MDVSAQISDELDPLSLKEWRSPARIAKWTDEEKIEFYLSCAWSYSRIKRETGMADAVLKEIVARVSKRKIQEIAEGDEEARAWQIDYLRECAAAAKDAYHEKLEARGKHDMRFLKAGREFLKDIRAIKGMDAPKKVNYDLAEKPAVEPAQQLAMVNATPALRAKWLANTAERRALAQELRGIGGPTDA